MQGSKIKKYIFFNVVTDTCICTIEANSEQNAIDLLCRKISFCKSDLIKKAIEEGSIKTQEIEVVQ